MLPFIFYMQPVNGPDDSHQGHDKTKNHRQTVNSPKGQLPIKKIDNTVGARMLAQVQNINKSH